MTKVAVLLADGFETVEALCVADVLRRAGIRTRLVSTMGTTHVITGQQVQVTADKTLDELDTADVNCFVVPGGMPAVKRLLADARVCRLLTEAMADPAATVAAICAGPLVLKELGLLEARRVTVFPSCAESFPPETLVDAPVVVDGNLITGRSMSCALAFSLALVERLAGPDAVRKVAGGIGAPSDTLPEGCAQ